MLAIELTLNLLVFAGIVVVSFVLGFMLRRKQLKSLKRKIFELEKEMLTNHADILELQRSKAMLELNLKTSKIPVISLNPQKEDGGDKLTDKALRK